MIHLMNLIHKIALIPLIKEKPQILNQPQLITHKELTKVITRKQGMMQVTRPVDNWMNWSELNIVDVELLCTI